MNAKTKNAFLMVICYCLCVAKLHHGEMSYFFVGIDVKCSLIEVCALPTVKSLCVEHSIYTRDRNVLSKWPLYGVKCLCSRGWE